MSENRLKLLETGYEEHHRRLSDHDGKLKAVLDWKASIEESTATNKRMIEVIEALIEAMGWAAKFARWVMTIVAFFGACWAGIKGAIYLGKL